VEKDAQFLEPTVCSFIHSYLSEFPAKELSHETGIKYTVIVHGQEAYMQWGTAWFLKGILET